MNNRQQSISSVKHNNLLYFLILISLLTGFTLGQYDTIEGGSFLYYLIMLPFMVVPLTKISQIIGNLFSGKVVYVTACSAISTVWSLINGDTSSAFLICFWLYIIAYMASDDSSLSVTALMKLFILILVAGIIIDKAFDTNFYGVFTPSNRDALLSGRISLYPNIGNTGFYAFAFFAIFTIDMAIAKKYWWILLVCLYFAVFSKVRSVEIAICIYLAFRYILTRYRVVSTGKVICLALLFIIVPLLLTNAYMLLYNLASNNELLTQIFFRGQGNLSADELEDQIFRPLAWLLHIDTFLDSNLLMGVGQTKLQSIIDNKLKYGDSIAFLTRLLAIYGLPAVLFVVQMFVWLKRHALERDYWACALFPAIFFLMMSWGAVFHPANGFSMLLMLILINGSSMIVAIPKKSAGRS